MKKLVNLLPFVFLLACGTGGDATPKEAAANTPAKPAGHSPAFSSSFQKLLDTYYSLTGSLVEGNDTLAAKLGTTLANRTDSISLEGMEKDTTVYQTTKAILESVKSEAIGLSGEANIENRRKSYQMVSDAMYDLVRTVKYDGQTIYHQFCPMAFDNQGAYWLSNSPDIKNPYFGKKMPNCGETKDSLSFTSK